MVSRKKPPTADATTFQRTWAWQGRVSEQRSLPRRQRRPATSGSKASTTSASVSSSAATAKRNPPVGPRADVRRPALESLWRIFER